MLEAAYQHSLYTFTENAAQQTEAKWTPADLGRAKWHPKTTQESNKHPCFVAGVLVSKKCVSSGAPSTANALELPMNQGTSLVGEGMSVLQGEM